MSLRTVTSSDFTCTARQAILRLIAFCTSAIPLVCHAGLGLHLSEADDDSVRISLTEPQATISCMRDGSELFNPATGVRKLTEGHYEQRLDSEASDYAVYLKAARMGGGIYMYLPYFVPVGHCRDAEFEVSARHILWNGRWHAGNVRIHASAVRGKSLFFTNEAAPHIAGASYLDAAIPEPMRSRIGAAFDSIAGFYRDTLHVDALHGTGVVAAIVRNDGGYTGFGGDATSIIRMSVDNPRPSDLAALDRTFAATFAHELAHKLQSERLFARPFARYIVEGGADFMKLVVLRSAALIDDDQARRLVRKAVADCAHAADHRSMAEKLAQQAVAPREPYDCGMMYYAVAYYASGLSPEDFISAFRAAMSGDGSGPLAACLLFETTCTDPRLAGVAAGRSRFLEQAGWLEAQLSSRPLPVLRAGD